jgi:ribosomal protein L19
MPYSSLNVFAGSILAIRKVGAAVAMNVTRIRMDTTVRIVGTS